MNTEERLKASLHESGHAVISRRCGMDVVKATIDDDGRGYVVPSWMTYLKMAVSVRARGMFHLSGLMTEKYFCPSSTHYASHDEWVLGRMCGMFPGTRLRREYERKIEEYLDDPAVREEILTTASRLMIQGSVTFG